jgi:hypothetical protein
MFVCSGLRFFTNKLENFLKKILPVCCIVFYRKYPVLLEYGFRVLDFLCWTITPQSMTKATVLRLGEVLQQALMFVGLTNGLLLKTTPIARFFHDITDPSCC